LQGRASLLWDDAVMRFMLKVMGHGGSEVISHILLGNTHPGVAGHKWMTNLPQTHLCNHQQTSYEDEKAVI